MPTEKKNAFDPFYYRPPKDAALWFDEFCAQMGYDKSLALAHFVTAMKGLIEAEELKVPPLVTMARRVRSEGITLIDEARPFPAVAGEGHSTAEVLETPPIPRRRRRTAVDQDQA